MANKITLARVAIIVSAVSFGVGAVTIASQHPFSRGAYVEVVLAVSAAAVGGFIIERNEDETTAQAKLFQSRREKTQ